MNFENKVALVTGGTSGIGKEIAKQLLRNGAKVIINYAHNEEIYKKTKNELEEYKDNVLFIKADVSNEDEVIRMFQQIEKLDYLVNNAGTNIDSYIEEFNIEDFRRVLDVNLVGKVICTKHAVPLLKNSKTSSIVNIASRLGTRPCIEASAYCSAEAGIINFTQASALELSKYSIRVNTVSPSLTITPLALEGWTEQEIEKHKQNNPLKRLGETIDIANAVLFLLSEKASYINGENLNVNGGSLLK